MPATTKKPPSRRAKAQAEAAANAEQLSKLLHVFAKNLQFMNELAKATTSVPTSRNWWQLQAGRFKDDPTFPEFVDQVRATRKREG